MSFSVAASGLVTHLPFKTRGRGQIDRIKVTSLGCAVWLLAGVLALSRVSNAKERRASMA